jgi:hypothetical protein
VKYILGGDCATSSVLTVVTCADDTRKERLEQLTVLVLPTVVEPDQEASENRRDAWGRVGVLTSGEPRDGLHRTDSVLAGSVSARVQLDQVKVEHWHLCLLSLGHAARSPLRENWNSMLFPRTCALTVRPSRLA